MCRVDDESLLKGAMSAAVVKITPVDGGDSVDIPDGKTTIGRGTFLQVNSVVFLVAFTSSINCIAVSTARFTNIIDIDLSAGTCKASIHLIVVSAVGNFLNSVSLNMWHLFTMK